MSSRTEDAIARVREALAEDERTNTLDVDVRVSQDAIVLAGTVANEERRSELEQVALDIAPPGYHVVNRVRVVSYSLSPRSAPSGALRVAAVGDIHIGEDSVGMLRARLEAVPDHADLLLLAGDLTQRGTIAEGRVLAGDLRDLGVPTIAVLGNHDYHSDHEHDIRLVLEDAGVIVLEGETVTLELRGNTVGIAGAKGFGSGFAGACATEFGEPEMKGFVRHAKEQANKLEAALRSLHTDVRIALLHFSPVADTLEGEPREIYPFLGSYLLADALDAAGCDLALHGHAHRGAELGMTPGGVPVRNVAQQVIREAYRVYRVEAHARIAVQPAFR